MSLKSCQTAYGPCKFYGKDEYIGRSLYAYGEWSGEECEKLVTLGKGLCLDVGANIGFMSMALASRYPVIAFEPQLELFRLLENNVYGKSVECHNVALGSGNGIAHMPIIRYGDRGNYGGVPIVKKSFGTREVLLRTLDSYNFENVGLIKIDVEGYELDVLRGAVNTITRCSPTLYVEDDREDKRSALRTFIKSLGYTIEEHRTRLFRENNFLGNKKDIWEAPYESHNIICSK
jgi:FkbM family methyltransferase